MQCLTCIILKLQGLMGFRLASLKKQWGLVGDAVIKFVLGVLESGVVLEECYEMMVMLIPKIEVLEVVGHFCPISLYNISYKIIIKIIVNCIKSVISHLVMAAQRSFLFVRHLHDNVMVLQEILHFMRRRKGRSCFNDFGRVSGQKVNYHGLRFIFQIMWGQIFIKGCDGANKRYKKVCGGANGLREAKKRVI